MSANIAIKSELSVILPIFLAFFVRSPFKTLFCKTMPWLNLLFSGAFRKEVKETSTLTKPSPIWEGCSWKSRHAADFQSFGMALKPLPLWGSPCFLIPTTLNTRRSKGDDNTWRKRQKSKKHSARGGLQRLYYFENFLRFLCREARQANRHEMLSERSEFIE